MRVLLIWPNSRNEVLGWGDLGAVAEPLALEYLAAGALADGHEVRILDLRLHPTELEETLTAFAPDVVGVTAFSMHVRTALKICRRVRELRPSAVTIAGGHHATLLPEDFFEPEVDFVVCGEGVRPLRVLLRAISRRERVLAIPGVWARLDGTFCSGGEQPTLEINDLPTPARQLTAADRHAYFIDWMRPVALVRTTVGCPFRCTFCSLWQIMDGRYHLRDVDAVVAEMSTIAEEWVFLIDDEAFINGKRMSQLATALAAAGAHKRYFAYCRIDTLVREREAVAAWREIGLERLFIGIDAISPEDLTQYNKRYQLDQIDAGLATARDLGIDVFAQFVVNPNYGKRDFSQLIRFIEHHRIDYPSFTVLTPIPGTPLLKTFDDVLERQPNGRPNWDLFDCQNAVVETALPPDEFRREYRNLYRVFKGKYTQYREHNELLDAAVHDGPPSVRTEQRGAAVFT